MSTTTVSPAYSRWTWIIALLLALVLLLAWFLGAWKPNECCSNKDAAAALAAAPAVVPPPPSAPAPAEVPAKAVDKPVEAAPAPAAEASAPSACDAATVKPIAFALGSSNLSPRHKQQLGSLAKCLKGSQDKLEVAGHTDSTGNPTLNLQLSELRSQRVAAYLVRLGVDKARVSAKGYGDTKPLADNSTPVGRKENRRIEFVKQ